MNFNSVIILSLPFMNRQQYHYHNKVYYSILVIIFNNKMETIIDYRNAKYQGQLSIQKQKHGTGILIDDDLTFYCSTWKNNQLNGNTLIYLTHGKYIYGEWKNNQPNGINVFRFGETVLVASFQLGKISSRILVIFERYNFISILEISGQDMRVVQRGQLYTNEDLINYVKLLDIKLPESYFSLVKYLCAFVSSDIKLVPNKKGDCYFGFDDGLALVFNNNNGIVSIGVHKNGDLVQFGQKCDHKCITQQGNFETNEVFQYKKQRPKQQIYSIFQKMHKRSLTFQNSYFHSKSSTIQFVQNLLRGKIAQIVEYSRQKITQAQLNDSLDYQPLTQEQYNQISIKRLNVYQTPKNSMKKTMSKIQQQPISSTQLSQQKTPKKLKTKIYLQKQIVQQKTIPSPIFVQKFNNLKKDASLTRSKSKQKLSINIPQINYEKSSQNCYNQDTFSEKPVKNVHRKESYEPINMNIRRAKYENQNMYEQQQSAILNPKGFIYKQKSEAKVQIKLKNQSPYKLETKYEDLNERRSRLLKQFKNMNDVLKEESKVQKQHLQKLSNNRTNYDRRSYENMKLERQNYQKKNIRTNNHYIENLQKKQYQSPYARQGMSCYISKKSDTQSNGCIPLSMAQLININNLEKQYEQIPRSKVNVFQMTATFDNNIYLSPTKRKAKLNAPLVTVNEVQNVEQINASPLRQHNKQYQQKIGKFTPSQRKYQYYFD